MRESLPLSSSWFDGQSPSARPCTLRIEAGALVLDTESGERRYPTEKVRWPERRSHGLRQARLPDGAVIQHADTREWDAWWRMSGQRESIVVGWTQSWRATGLALLVTLLLVAAAWFWGVALASRVLLHAVPPSLEASVGQRAMQQLEKLYLLPTQLKQRERDEWHRRFAALVERNHPPGEAPNVMLWFYRSPSLGANAFALPGGQVVITDELVILLRDEPDAILGVMAHELSHVRHRDGLDMLFRATLTSAVAGIVMGDVGGVVAALPAMLATQGYSREAERRADREAADMLRKSGKSPSVMVTFFERMRPSGASATPQLPIAIGSHPHDEERIRFFREQAQPPSTPNANGRLTTPSSVESVTRPAT